MRKLAFKVFTTIFFGFHDHDHVDLGMVDNLYTILNLGMKSMAINLSGFVFHKKRKVSLYKFPLPLHPPPPAVPTPPAVTAAPMPSPYVPIDGCSADSYYAARSLVSDR
ncbi:hypothetical protein HN51_034043 [Arachis hypogaea]